MEISTAQLIDAIDSWLFYNGIDEEVSKWEYLKANNNIICAPQYSKEAQPVWMICVELFGDCGTSPRTGWVYAENAEPFKEFIRSITKTRRGIEDIY